MPSRRGPETIPTEKRSLVDGIHDSDRLREMLARIGSRAQHTCKETVAFRAFNLRFTTDKAALLDLYRRIFDGTIRPCAGSIGAHAPLGDFGFARSEISDALVDRRHLAGWTAQELAGFTGWKEQCISHWCDAGLLGHSARPHFRGTMRTIAPEDLTTFQRQYIPVASLAKDLGRSSHGLFKDLAEAGVQTCGEHEDGSTSRGNLLRISDLLPDKKQFAG